jgi:hypothetical protein
LGQIGIAGLLAVVLINHSFPLLSPQSTDHADLKQSAQPGQADLPSYVVEEANLWSSGRSDFAGSAGEDRKLDANGWGSGESEDSESFDEPEPPQGADSGDDEAGQQGESDWGGTN